MTAIDPHTVARTLNPFVNVVLTARAQAEVIREEIDAIKLRLLTEHAYTDETDGKRVTEPKYDWCMPQEQFTGYLALLEEGTREAGYDVPKDFCPALMAEETLRKAERALIDAACVFFPGTTTSALLRGTKDSGGLETHRRYLDLLTGLVVNHPSFERPQLAAG